MEGTGLSLGLDRRWSGLAQVAGFGLQAVCGRTPSTRLCRVLYRRVTKRLTQRAAVDGGRECRVMAKQRCSVASAWRSVPAAQLLWSIFFLKGSHSWQWAGTGWPQWERPHLGSRCILDPAVPQAHPWALMMMDYS